MRVQNQPTNLAHFFGVIIESALAVVCNHYQDNCQHLQ